MHDAVFYSCLIWLTGLLGVLVGVAVRRREAVDVILALDTLTLVLVAVLGLFAAYRRSEGYLDAALVLALIAFVQTVVAVRYLRGQKGAFS
ncbi:MrpF/PhaF family protein [Archangium violaceum]|uniref:monovalent cation/H+ antiporter complex subunit F n=1 Tax=Archangium violaceum TaxID=83451 RepID=UPI00193C774B|nr:MrpF/PhaF family protein [Archangium violaceum]QRK05914.1 MrpF/PhaF family protein [Archangium violaceum]